MYNLNSCVFYTFSLLALTRQVLTFAYNIRVRLGPEVIIIFFMLSSAKHKISNAYNYKSIKIFSYFQAKISIECYFSSS